MDMDAWLEEKFKSLDSKLSQIQKDIVQVSVSPKTSSSSSPEHLDISPSDLVIQLALDGIVWDENKAKTSGCKCVSLPKEEKQLCWAKGIIGALSQKQVKKYCTPENTVIEETKLPSHVEKFIEASDACKKGQTYDGKKIKNLQDRLVCMHKMLEGSEI